MTINQYSQSRTKSQPGNALQSLLSSIFYSSNLIESQVTDRFSAIKYRPWPQAKRNFQSAQNLKPIGPIDKELKIEQKKYHGRYMKITPRGVIPYFSAKKVVPITLSCQSLTFYNRK